MNGKLKVDDAEIYWGSSENMGLIDDKSIDSIITSPPYWNLKDYGHKGQLGASSEDYNEYLSRLSNVMSECYGKLSSRGTMWVVADTFSKSGNTKLLPYHIIEMAENIGFELINVIVWYKPTSIAGMNPGRLVNKKEYILALSRSSSFDLYPNRAKPGEEDPAVNEIGDLTNVWRHPVKRGSLAKENSLHKAPFPLSLAKRLIRISTKEGDSVLDPFIGSGTTAEAALKLRRDVYGYEINPEFESTIRSRISDISETNNYADASTD